MLKGPLSFGDSRQIGSPFTKLKSAMTQWNGDWVVFSAHLLHTSLGSPLGHHRNL